MPEPASPTAETIQLDNTTWTAHEALGEQGAFGIVRRGIGPDGEPVAIKFVRIEPAAERELLLASVDSPDHVIPVLDSGEYNGFHVLVMPLANKSLAQHIVDSPMPMGTADALAILIDIADALVAIEGDLVHRDLKPANLLLHQDQWKLTDFGTSRYAEASTAEATHKHTGTSPYVAPERWRSEHAKVACDVYSFGVIAHELLAGEWPFPGPDVADFRDQHLHHDPPTLTGVPASLRSLVQECLYKAPGARPTPSNLAARLTRLRNAPAPRRRPLAEANLQAVATRAQNQRAFEAAVTEAEKRKDLLTAACAQWQAFLEHLRREIEDDAPAAQV